MGFKGEMEVLNNPGKAISDDTLVEDVNVNVSLRLSLIIPIHG